MILITFILAAWVNCAQIAGGFIKTVGLTNVFFVLNQKTDMYAHGGKELGSAGYVDLADKMEDFYKDFSKYDDDLIMNVKYDEDYW